MKLMSEIVSAIFENGEVASRRRGFCVDFVEDARCGPTSSPMESTNVHMTKRERGRRERQRRRRGMCTCVPSCEKTRSTNYSTSLRTTWATPAGIILFPENGPFATCDTCGVCGERGTSNKRQQPCFPSLYDAHLQPTTKSRKSEWL